MGVRTRVKMGVRTRAMPLVIFVSRVTHVWNKCLRSSVIWSLYRREYGDQGVNRQAERVSKRHKLSLDSVNDALIRFGVWVFVFVVVQVSHTFIQIIKRPKWALRHLKVYTCALKKIYYLYCLWLSKQILLL